MAVVLYNPPLILEHFHNTERNFEFPGLKDVVIHQDWNSHGVAAVVWEAAVILSTYLQNISHVIKDKNILELGSGTGLTGIVACQIGAKVTFTDKNDELDLCKKNIRKNLNKKDHVFNVKPLNWMEVSNEKWCNVKYDYIIGADLVYIEELFPHLISTFKFFAQQNDNLSVLLAGKIRYQERYNKFLCMAKKIFSIEQILYDDDKSVYILKIKLKQ